MWRKLSLVGAWLCSTQRALKMRSDKIRRLLLAAAVAASIPELFAMLDSIEAGQISPDETA